MCRFPWKAATPWDWWENPGAAKSVTALSLMRLVPNPPGRIESGRIMFQNRNLLNFNEDEMRDLRGNEISMIFQEPMTSLNPVLRSGIRSVRCSACISA
jgi:ABC-type dipeptide/oligopeptide/nickel transport system ATPase component